MLKNNIQLKIQQIYGILKYINSDYYSIMQKDQNSRLKNLEARIETVCSKIGRQNFGMILMLISQIIWPLSFIYANQQNLNAIETNLVRASITVVSHFGISHYIGVDTTIKNNHNLKYTLIRSTIMSAHQFMLTLMQFVLPASIVFTLNLVAVLAIFPVDYLMYGTTVNRQQKIGVFFGFLGVLVTVNGQFIMDMVNQDLIQQTDFKNYITNDPFVKLILSIVFTILNLGRAYCVVITKRFVRMTSIEISFHLGWILLLYSGLLYPYAVTKPTNVDVMLKASVFSGIPQNIAQILFFSSQLLCKNTGLLNIISFVTVGVGYGISILRYHEAINYICVVGLFIIIYGISKAILNRQNSNPSQIKIQKQLNFS